MSLFIHPAPPVHVENTQVGPFHIHERLGSRRQRVFRAHQVEQDIEVALKFIGLPKKAKRAEALKKIKIEVDLLRKLSHPNLVQIYGAGVEKDQIFFATQLVDGESLTALLSRRGKFAPDQVVDCGRQIASLLDYLHEQDIIHSKLTPDKLIFNSAGDIKVADLRLNRSRKRRWDSARQRELDIAAYMAPEQFNEGATPKSDIYSLGVIMYEMLTGKLPYEPDTLGRMALRKMNEEAPPVSSLLMNCPVWLDKVICQMVSPDPRQRPHTAKAVILAMDELRLIDETKKSSVSQVSGGFNPLTAGADKAEADHLLGNQKRGPRFSLPAINSTIVMSVAFIAVLGVLLIALWPNSPTKNLAEARTLMASKDSADWREARGYLRKVIDAKQDGPLLLEAEELYIESRRRTLIQQAEHGRIHALQSPNAQKFIRAFQIQLEGKLDEVRADYQALVDSVDPNGKEKHIYLEAAARLQQLGEQKQAPSASETIPESTDATAEDPSE